MLQVPASLLPSEDGYRLWLRYEPIADSARLEHYRAAIRGVALDANSPTLLAVEAELRAGLAGLLGQNLSIVSSARGPGVLYVGTPASAHIAELGLDELGRIGSEGFIIRELELGAGGATGIAIAANTDVGVLYGVFRFLRLLQTHASLDGLDLVSAPSVRYRLLDHWDNLDRSVERGYAGCSLWDWHLLPQYVAPRYADYARANASIGLNGAVLNNVNANARILTAPFLGKVAAIADVLRPYGMRVYLSARFSAPIEIGGLDTADPFDPRVKAWWRDKAREIYAYVPDFGGFLVKANSEGQPGPQKYGRTHADGANLLADALEDHGGIVIWRAFVYDQHVPEDRAKQAYDEFKPLDGAFRENVLVQVKNGPIDFQPREPFHPLFGAMPETPLVLELQITQEYLGFATHLAYLAPLFKECLDADTHAQGPGSSVAKVISGALHGHARSGIAAVSNIGSERNWCGHPFAQANWYAFGRLAWDPELSSEAIAEDWLRMTFTHDPRFLEPAKRMLLESREAVVRYMTPLGLHHLMAKDHHYGPGPWVDDGRPDWTSVYYHCADSAGIGFDRTPDGSDATSQYFPPVARQFANAEACPKTLLLWFHHVKWTHQMPSGRTLWAELCHEYQRGVDTVRRMQQSWAALEDYVDAARFRHVSELLKIQESEARWWQAACLAYFQTFSQFPIPDDCEKPPESLEHYKAIRHYYVPGN